MSGFDVLKGKIGAVLNRWYKKPAPHTDILRGYSEITDITPKWSRTLNRVGVYTDEKGSRVIIKRTSFHHKDLDAVYLLNEASVLQSLTDTHGVKLFPVFKKVIRTENEVALVTSFENGTPLHEMSANVRRDVIQKAYERLAGLSSELQKNNFFAISVRSPFSFFLAVPVLCGKAILQNPRHCFSYIKNAVEFYLSYCAGMSGGTSRGLVHRDLYADNILYSESNDSITLLDWESAVVTDPLYDLAQIAMIYHADFGMDNLIAFLKEHLENNTQRRRFRALAIFNGLQILSQNSAKSEVFKDTFHFLNTVLPELYRNLYYKKSPFELINGFTLTVIFYFYKVIKLPVADRRKKILLCYHSIGNDGWRFSTRTELFKSHIAALKKHYTFETLPRLLSEDKGGININFDDGYKNVYTNAYPILWNEKIPATVFAIGDPENADRGELENNVPFMSIENLQKLKKAGWEIGFHTATHGPVAQLNEKQLEKEIGVGKRAFENKLGFSLDFLAYPKGFYNEAVLRAVRNAGFKAAFTVDGKEMRLHNADPMLLDRVPVDGELNARQLIALISPIGLKVAALFLRILQLKEKYTSRSHN